MTAVKVMYPCGFLAKSCVRGDLDKSDYNNNDIVNEDDDEEEEEYYGYSQLIKLDNDNDHSFSNDLEEIDEEEENILLPHDLYKEIDYSKTSPTPKNATNVQLENMYATVLPRSKRSHASKTSSLVVLSDANNINFDNCTDPSQVRDENDIFLSMHYIDCWQSLLSITLCPKPSSAPYPLSYKGKGKKSL